MADLRRSLGNASYVVSPGATDSGFHRRLRLPGAVRPCRGERTIVGMAYDEKLAGRIRELVAGERGVTEKKMFGGLAFLLNGNMAVAASGQGGLLVRVDAEASDALMRERGTSLMEMRGRELPGWMRVDADAVRTKKELSAWVGRGVSFARSLPPKR